MGENNWGRGLSRPLVARHLHSTRAYPRRLSSQQELDPCLVLCSIQMENLQLSEFELNLGDFFKGEIFEEKILICVGCFLFGRQ